MISSYLFMTDTKYEYVYKWFILYSINEYRALSLVMAVTPWIACYQL